MAQLAKASSGNFSASDADVYLEMKGYNQNRYLFFCMALSLRPLTFELHLWGVPALPGTGSLWAWSFYCH